jgi:hypothetical protein
MCQCRPNPRGTTLSEDAARAHKRVFGPYRFGWQQGEGWFKPSLRESSPGLSLGYRVFSRVKDSLGYCLMVPHLQCIDAVVAHFPTFWKRGKVCCLNHQQDFQGGFRCVKVRVGFKADAEHLLEALRLRGVLLVSFAYPPCERVKKIVYVVLQSGSRKTSRNAVGEVRALVRSTGLAEAFDTDEEASFDRGHEGHVRDAFGVEPRQSCVAGSATLATAEKTSYALSQKSSRDE